MLNSLLDELGIGLFWMLFGQCNECTILHLAGIVSHCEPDNAPLLAQKKTNEGRWFIKLITADYKLKHNMKVNKQSQQSESYFTLLWEFNRRNWLYQCINVWS